MCTWQVCSLTGAMGCWGPGIKGLAGIAGLRRLKLAFFRRNRLEARAFGMACPPQVNGLAGLRMATPNGYISTIASLIEKSIRLGK